MANIVTFSSSNPIKLVLKDLDKSPKYNFVHLDDGLFTDQILSFQQKKVYFQKWQNSDYIKFQFSSNFGAASFRLVDCFGAVKYTGTVVPIVTDVYIAPTVGYQCFLDLADVEAGIYWAEVVVGTSGNEVTFISEPMQVRDFFINTMPLEFTNSENDFNLIFQNGDVFMFRLEAIFTECIPYSNDVVGEDDPANLINLSSTPFRVYKFKIGGPQGVPDWVVDRYNRIRSCDKVLYSGKEFTKVDGAKLERTGDPFSALAGWSVDLRERRNASALVVENNIALSNEISLLYDLDLGSYADLVNPPLSNDILIIVNN